ncbi:MAG: prepilin-type N-terminal cleavage/methylation domain-containing protein [bacterium]|nr:prepilin-type N-terminal cleavage/methylation domain-containing protein [bacterium]
MKNLNKNFNSGLTLVEVLIATSIILVFLLAFSSVHNLYLKTAFSNGEVIKATELAEESLEVVRFLRDSSWNTNIAPLSLGTDYYLVFEGGGWQVTTTEALVDGLFERVVTLSAVYRDASADIVSGGGGTLDPGTLLVVSSVSWSRGEATTTKSISTYITNIFAN